MRAICECVLTLTKLLEGDGRFLPMGMSWGSLVALASVIAVGGGVTAVGVAVSSSDGALTPAKVVKVVDGDTVDVRYDEATHRVRLLNIDTPERGGHGRDGECMADEATSFLRNRLPVGATVELEWDTEHEDKYGRQLRGVYDDRGLVNADIARAGLAVPMHIAPNHRYRDEVDQAYADASKSRQGLFDPSEGCTLTGRTERVNKAVEDGDAARAYKEAVALRTIIADPDSFAVRMMRPSELEVTRTRLHRVIVGHSTTKKTSTPSAKPTPTRAPAPKPKPKPAPEPAPAPEPKPAPEPAPAPEPKPAPEPAPAPVNRPESP